MYYKHYMGKHTNTKAISQIYPRSVSVLLQWARDILRTGTCLLLPLSLPIVPATMWGSLQVSTKTDWPDKLRKWLPNSRKGQSHYSYWRKRNHCAVSLHSALGSETSWHSIWLPSLWSDHWAENYFLPTLPPLQLALHYVQHMFTCLTRLTLLKTWKNMAFS
jgi:hypothetical protein